MKIAFGLVIAVCLGIFCRFFDLPLPGPPAIMGAVMAIAMASGYTATEYAITRQQRSSRAINAVVPKIEPLPELAQSKDGP